MKKKSPILILLFALILSPSSKVNAQTDASWQPIYLLVTGHNVMDGVEAFFQVNACNNEDIIYIKYINHNEYDVKLEWFDAVFTQELKWINKDQAADKKSLLLPSKKEVNGKCSSNLYPELSIKIKVFVADKNDFKRYSASQLHVNSVQ